MEDSAIGVPDFKLLMQGNELADDLQAAIDGVAFEDEINLPAMFTVKRHDDR